MSTFTEWIVNYGPDPSHICHRCRLCGRLKDAERLVRRLPKGRPWQIVRMEHPKGFGVASDVRVVRQSF